MPQSAVAPDIHEPLDVHLDLGVEGALHPVLGLDLLTELGRVLFAQVLDPDVLGSHARSRSRILAARLRPMPKMYVSAISTRFSLGRSTPAIRATWFPPSRLPIPAAACGGGSCR